VSFLQVLDAKIWQLQMFSDTVHHRQNWTRVDILWNAHNMKINRSNHVYSLLVRVTLPGIFGQQPLAAVDGHQTLDEQSPPQMTRVDPVVPHAQTLGTQMSTMVDNFIFHLNRHKQGQNTFHCHLSEQRGRQQQLHFRWFRRLRAQL